MSIKGLVSVIVPFYDAASFLEETIASVIAQTYPHWEMILVDDGSSDLGPAIAREYATRHVGRITCVEHPGRRNRGLCASRNLGVRQARGEFIALLDSDDVWLPHKLEAQVKLMGAHPGAGLIYGRSEYWHDWNTHNGAKKKNHIPGIAPGGVLYEPSILLKSSHPLGSFGAPVPSSFLMRRTSLDRIGGFEECFNPDTHQLYEDAAFLAKVYLNMSVFVSDDCWDRYRQHDKSMCNVQERIGKGDAARRHYFDWLRNYLQTNEVDDPEIWRAISRRTWWYRHQLLSAGVAHLRRWLNLLRTSTVMPTRTLSSNAGGDEKRTQAKCS